MPSLFTAGTDSCEARDRGARHAHGDGGPQLPEWQCGRSGCGGRGRSAVAMPGAARYGRVSPLLSVTVQHPVECVVPPRRGILSTPGGAAPTHQPPGCRVRAAGCWPLSFLLSRPAPAVPSVPCPAPPACDTLRCVRPSAGGGLARAPHGAIPPSLE